MWPADELLPTWVVQINHRSEPVTDSSGVLFGFYRGYPCGVVRHHKCEHRWPTRFRPCDCARSTFPCFHTLASAPCTLLLSVRAQGEQQSLQNAEDNLQLAEHDGERCDLLHGLSYLTHPHASSTQLCRCLAGCQPVRCASGKSALVNPPTRNARSTLLTGNDRGRLGRSTPLRWRHLKMAERS